VTPRPERSGFTLIEVAAALALSGLALLGAILLVDQLHDSHVRLARRAEETARVANGARLLRRVLFDAEAGADSTQWFHGDEGSARFLSWCEMPSGWLERCGVMLALDRRIDSTAINATFSTGETITLAMQSGGSRLRYLDRGDEATWISRWTASVVMPAAISVVGPADSLIVAVGGGHD
jgi:prepilin-type N-terminal cleavage/methylation domain-containing protein